MPQSVLEAIKMGQWDFEPMQLATEATEAMPGSMEKLEVLAERLQRGLPLWHPADRLSYEEDAL